MKLTVLIPVFNTPAEQLIESVMSIYNQDDGTQHRIVLIDDCSTNIHTLRALDFLTAMLAGVEVAQTERNGGAAAALNYGHSLVKTEYVAIMGSDDIAHPSRFSKQIAYLKKNPNVDVLGTDLFSFYTDDIHRSSLFTSKHPEVPQQKPGNWYVNHGTVIYKQAAVMAVGGYNDAYRRAQDVELWGRMWVNKAVFRNLPEVLYAWRKRSEG